MEEGSIRYKKGSCHFRRGSKDLEGGSHEREGGEQEKDGVLADLESSEREQCKHSRHDPEPHDDLGFGHPSMLECVVDRRSE